MFFFPSLSPLSSHTLYSHQKFLSRISHTPVLRWLLRPSIWGLICIASVGGFAGSFVLPASLNVSPYWWVENVFFFFFFFGSWAYGELEKWFQFGGLDLVTIVGLALGFNGDNGFWFRWQQWFYVWVSTATVGLALGFNGAGGGFCFRSSFGLVLGFFFSLSLRFSFFAAKSGLEFEEFGFFSLLQSLYDFSFLCYKVWYGVWWVCVLFHEWIIGD